MMKAHGLLRLPAQSLLFSCEGNTLGEGHERNERRVATDDSAPVHAHPDRSRRTLRRMGLLGALLAATAAYIFLVPLPCYRIRRDVQRVRADMRTLATAIEAYYVGHSIYPAWGIGHPGPGAVRTWNWNVAQRTGNRSGIADLPSFLLCDRSTSAGCFNTFTTAVAFIGKGGWVVGHRGLVDEDAGAQASARGPNIQPGDHFAYIASYPIDRFCADSGATFVYWATFPGDPKMRLLGDETARGLGGVGWMMVSPGPDGDYDLPGSYHAYDPSVPQPSPLLLAGTNARGASFTYDPTNGLISDGDIWRVKQ